MEATGILEGRLFRRFCISFGDFRTLPLEEAIFRSNSFKAPACCEKVDSTVELESHSIGEAGEGSLAE